MSSFQCDYAAPVASESEPRPETKDQAGDAQHGAGPRQRFNVWNDAVVEQVGEPMAFRQQETAEQYRYRVTQSLRSAFPIDRLLGPERGQQPDDSK